MPPLRLLLPIVAVATLLPTPAFAKDRADSVESYVTQRMAETGVTGASLSIVEGDGVVHEQDFGSTGDGDPITEDTPFMWGSVVKPMTAALVLRLAESGDVDLDEPVRQYLPNFRPTLDGAIAEPTVAQLLSHTSGLPGIEGADVTDHDGRTDGVSAVAAQLDDIALATEPGAKHAYSSLNYLVAGAVVEAVADRPFREVLDQEILRPLGMTDTITDVESAANRMPSGNRLWAGMPIAQRTLFDAAGLPYGYIGGTRSALTAFARAALNHDERILGEDSWEAAQSPQAKTGAGHYGYGWSIREQAGETVVFHTGMTPGYHVNVLLVPQRDVAVVLTQNAYAEAWALPLRATSENVARLWTGREPIAAPGPDSLLATAPWVLGSIALLLLLVAGVSVARRGDRTAAGRVRRRAARPNRGNGNGQPEPHHPAESQPSPRPAWLRVTVWAAAGIATPVVVMWLVPLSLGVPLRMLWLFQPDVAAGLSAIAAATVVLAGVRCARLLRSARPID